MESLSQLPDESLWDHRAARPEVRDELVRRHLPLARALASRYRNVNDAFEDLVQVASLGLIRAVDRFDPERGRPFGSYAVPTILGELRRYFRDTGWSAHVPRRAKELALEVQRGADQLAERDGHSPTVPELSDHLGLEVEDVLRGMEASQAHFSSSLDAPALAPSVEDADGATLLDRTGVTDDAYGLVETRESLKGAIARLPYNERRALSLRVSGDLTQTQVAEQLGCSQMQISRLLRSASRTVRAELSEPV